MSEKKTPKQRITDAQRSYFIQYLVSHSYWAKHGIDPGQSGKEKGEQRWEVLTSQLNAIGRTKKTVKGWKQTYSDMKLRVKKKAADLKNMPTGNPQDTKGGLTDEEYSLYILCGERDLIGSGKEDELGLPNANCHHHQEAAVSVSGLDDRDDDPDDLDNWPPPSPPSQPIPDESNVEEPFYEEIDLPYPELGLPYDRIVVPGTPVPPPSTSQRPPQCPSTSSLRPREEFSKKRGSSPLRREEYGLKSQPNGFSSLSCEGPSKENRPLNISPSGAATAGVTEKQKESVQEKEGKTKEKSTAGVTEKQKESVQEKEGKTKEKEGKTKEKEGKTKEKEGKTKEKWQLLKRFRMAETYERSTGMFTSAMEESQRLKMEEIEAIRQNTAAINRLADVGDKVFNLLSQYVEDEAR